MERERWAVAIGGHSLKKPEDVQNIIKLLFEAADKRNAIISLLGHGSGPQAGDGLDEFLKAPASGFNTDEFNKLVSTGNEAAICNLGGQIKEQITALHKSARVIVTRCLVNPDTMQPAKPIGRGLNEEEARKLSAILTVKKVDDNGSRVLVPSPLIKRIFQKDLKDAAQSTISGETAIAGGAGGLPYVCENHILKPVAAVIDKDWTLGELVKALSSVVHFDRSIILTRAPALVRDFGVLQKAIEQNGSKAVHANWREEYAKAGLIQNISLAEAEQLYEQGVATAGAGPKLGASIMMVRSFVRQAVICAPENLEASLDGTEESGTVIHR
ncbi:MAG: hypothetical protein PHU71_02670 [Candidatus Gracilibacteria bacterium]|nr:hypothetical protein [Candidatus Gracilibacteria bacterium]